MSRTQREQRRIAEHIEQMLSAVIDIVGDGIRGAHDGDDRERAVNDRECW